jgi:hypothetical protein
MAEIINMESVAINIDVEEENDDNPIISLPTIYRPMLLHFGSPAGYQRFEFSYFIKTISDPEENFIYKHIIHSVKYEPDKLYSTMDGMAGKCWIVEVLDVENEKSNKYYIRNWTDIVEYYNEKGLKFVMENA